MIQKNIDSAVENIDQDIKCIYYGNPVFWIMILFIEMIFIGTGSLNNILSMIVAILLFYFYVVKEEKVFVTVILLFANDALGSMLGFVAVKYLSLLFIVIELITGNTRIIRKALPIGVFMIYMIAQPFITGLDDTNALLSTLLPFLILIMLYGNDDKDNFLQKFAEGSTIIISLLALHAILTGGYAMYEDSMITGYIRKGILGVGDANFSCLILCTGIVCAINCVFYTKIIKISTVLVMIGAVSTTLSVAGFLSTCMVFLMSLLLYNNLNKKLRNALLGIFAMIVIVFIITLLPKTGYLSNVSLYMDRLMEKYNAFLSGNIAELTTGRSSISENYISFIGEQDLGKLLIGGNNLLQFQNVPHNTYIDFIIQFGLIGLFIVIGVSIRKLIMVSYSCKILENAKICVSLKVLFLFFIASISVYHGTAFVLMLFVLLVI